jgi:hypothetical protein
MRIKMIGIEPIAVAFCEFNGMGLGFSRADAFICIIYRTAWSPEAILNSVERGWDIL